MAVFLSILQIAPFSDLQLPFSNVSFFGAQVVQAAIPTTIGYQGRLKNSSGVAQDGNFSFTFRLYASSTGGTALWTEIQPTVAVDDGVFAVQLGSVTSFPASLDFNQPLFLTTEVNSDGEMTPRVTVNTVPYSFTTGGVNSFGSAPVSATGGRMYYDTTNGSLNYYDGISGIWKSLSSASGSSFTTLNWTNATGSTLHVSSVTFTSASGTGLTVQAASSTNLSWTNGAGVNTTSTNLFATNGSFTNGTMTNGTISNLSFTNGTSTSWFGFSTATGTTLGALSANITSLTAPTLISSNATISGGSLNGTLIGNITPSTGVFTNVTSTSATSTNFFATNLVATNASIANLTLTGPLAVSSLTWTNATGTNTTSTNLYVGGTASTTQLFANNGTIGTFTAGAGTITALTAPTLSFTNAAGTNVTSTNLAFTTASGTNLFASSIQVNGASVCLQNGTNCPAFNSTTETLAIVTARGSSATTTLQLYGGLVTASSTVTSTLTVLGNTSLQNTTFVNATGASVTTTNAFAANLSATNGLVSLLTFTSGTSTNWLGFNVASGSTIFASSVSVNGSLVCLANGSNCPAGNATPTLQQVTTAGNVTTDALQFNGGTSTANFLPSADAVLALGSSAFRWNGNFGTVTTTNLIATTGAFTTVTATTGTVTNFLATSATIATINNATFNGGNATFSNVTSTNVSASSVSTSQLFVNGQQITGAGSVTTATLQLITDNGAITTNQITAYGGIVTSNVNVTGTLTVGGSSSLTSLTFTNATGTSVTTTNLFATNGNFTNLTAGSFSPANITWTNATGTNTTSTNFFTTNGVMTNGSVTNLLFGHGTSTSWFGFTTASGTTLHANAGNIAVLTAPTLISSNATISGGSLNGTLIGNITPSTGVFTNVTSTSATSTNFFATNLVATNASIANLTLTGPLAVSSLTWTNATGTNTTSTNLYVGGTASTTQLFANNGTIGTFYAGSLTGNAGSITTLSTSFFTASQATTTILSFGTASGTDLFASSIQVNGSSVCLQNGANCPGAAATTSTLQMIASNGASTTHQLYLFGGLIAASSTVTSTLTVLGDTSLQNTTFVNATGTSVTTTNLATTNLNATNGLVSLLDFTHGTSTNWLGFNVASGSTIFASSIAVNGSLVCLQNGTNCPTGTVSDLQTVTNAGNTTTRALQFNGGTSTADFLPSADAVLALGSSAFRWNGNFGTVTTTNLIATTGVFTTVTAATGTVTTLNSVSLNSVNGAFQNVTSTNVTTTNLAATTVSTSQLFVNGQAITTNGSSGVPATTASLQTITANGATTTNLISAYGGLTTSILTVTGTSDLQTLTFTNATGISVTSTNLFAVNGSFTNLTADSFSPTNLTWTNATGTNTTSTNFFTTNGVLTNGTITNLSFGNGTSTSWFGFTTASGTTINANSGNIAVLTAPTFISSNVAISGGTINGTQIGNVTPGTAVFTNATATSATSTNFFATNLSATNATIANLTLTGPLAVSSLTWTNATGTNTTSTNLYVGGTASTTQLFANNGTVGALNVGSITGNTGSVTTLSTSFLTASQATTTILSFETASGTNFFASSIQVNGSAVCLQNGLNCPASSSGEINWTFDASSGFVRVSTTTNDLVIGATASATAPFYFDVNSPTSSLQIGRIGNANLLVGTSTYGGGLNSLFALNGDDAFIQGNLGVASSVYTNGVFAVGASTVYTSNTVTNASGDFTVSSTNGGSLYLQPNAVGRVRIGGTATPNARLSVGDGSNAADLGAGYVISINEATNRSAMAMVNAGGSLGEIGVGFYSGVEAQIVGTVTNMPLFLEANNSIVARIDQNGNVGIGLGATLSPSTKLEVLGAVSSTGGLFVGQNNVSDIGSPTSSWRNVYASGTTFLAGVNFINGTGTNIFATNVTTTNFSFATASGTNLFATAISVNGSSVCLQNGTNCPAAASGDSNWAFNGTSNFIRPATSTNDLVIGATASATAPFYFDVESPTSSLQIGRNGNANLFVGTSTYGGGISSLFAINGDDAFIQGSLGSASSVYSGGVFAAGTTSTTMLGAGFITQNAGNLSVSTTNGNLILQPNAGGYSASTQGRVGIGNSNPQARLHIGNAGTPATTAAVYVADSAGALLELHDTSNNISSFMASHNYNGTPGMSIGTLTSNNYLSFYVENTRAMTIEPGTQFVGVGTADPSVRMDVLGSVSSTNILTGAIFTRTNNAFAIGSATTSFSDVYASGTAFIGTNVIVNGSSVCLQNGTNCPSSVQAWADDNTSNFIRPSTSTRDVVIGATASATAPFYFDVNSPTSSLQIGRIGNANLLVGTSTYGGGLNSLFALNGDDAFIQGNLGVASSVYTNGLLASGNTLYGDGMINKTNGSLVVTSSQNIVFSPSGNVGIATSTPTAKLTVVGGVQNTFTSSQGFTQLATIAGLNGPYGIEIQGRLMYVVSEFGGGTLRVYDVSDPSNPALLSSLADATGDGTRFVAVAGGYAYVTNRTENRVRIINVTNPSAPYLVSSVTVNTPEAIAISGRYVYVTENSSGALVTIDVSNPSAPQIVSTLDLGGGANGIKIQGSYAYISNASDGTLEVVNISNPSQPVVADDVAASGSLPFQPTVNGTVAYLPSLLSDTLDVIDISNPTNIRVLRTLTTDDEPYGAQLSGRYLYLLNAASDNITVYDVASSTNPIRVFTQAGIGAYYLAPIAVNGRYVYVTDFDGNGVDIFRQDGLETAALEAHAAEFGSFSARQNGSIANNLFVGTALEVGFGGILSNGALSVNTTNTTSTIGYAVSSTRMEVSSRLTVGGVNVCLQNGTNCPSSVQAWADDNTSNFIRPSTSTRDVVIGATASATAPFYFDVNSPTSSFQIGRIGNGNLFVGTSTYGGLLRSLFGLNGDDAFIQGSLGVASSVFTNGALYVGTSTVFGSNLIDAFGQINVSSSGSIVLNPGASPDAGSTRKVGIGETNPQALLQIGNGAPGIAAQTAFAVNTNVASQQYNSFRETGTGVQVDLLVGNFGINIGAMGTATNHPFQIFTNNDDGLTVWNNAENHVGIGTNAVEPTTKLEVVGAVSSTGMWARYIVPQRNNLYNLGSVTGSWANIYASGTASLANLIATNATATNVTTTNINSINAYRQNGVVGISVDCAADQFVGNQTVSGGITTAGACEDDTAVLSDARLKEQVQGIGSVLYNLLNVNVVSYKWNQEAHDNFDLATGTKYGVIADELEILFPELVTMGSDGYKRVNYEALGMYTLQGLTEVADILAEQQSRIDAWHEYATTTALSAGSVSTTELLVNGKRVCLEDGTNCPSGQAKSVSSTASVVLSGSESEILAITTTPSLVGNAVWVSADARFSNETATLSTVTMRIRRGLCETGVQVGVDRIIDVQPGESETLTASFVDVPATTTEIGYRVCVTNAGGISEAEDRSMVAQVVTQGADLGEVYYTTDQTLSPGELVAIAEGGNALVRRASRQSGSIGVVSTRPGQLLSETSYDNGMPVILGLAGRVPVKVSTENGVIRSGDALTISSIDGIAMKATEAGVMIGRALSDFESGADGSPTGLVMMFIQNGYFIPSVTSDEVMQSESGNETILSSAQAVHVVESTQFDAEVHVVKHLYQGEDAAGFAKVLSGSHAVQVKFREKYLYPPVVALTPYTEIQGAYWVEQATEEGFTIRMAEAISERDTTFSWSVTAVKEPMLYVSDGTFGKLYEEDRWRGQIQEEVIEVSEEIPEPVILENPEEEPLDIPEVMEDLSEEPPDVSIQYPQATSGEFGSE